MSLALSSFFNIRPGEGKKAAIMFLYSLFMVSGVFVLGRSIGRALFLSALPKEAIAYRFILPPLGVMLVAAGYTRLVRRYTVKQLILGSTGLLIAGLLGFRLLLETPYGHSFAVLAPLYILFEVIVLLVPAQFWAFASELFDPRQGKRLFGLIGAGGTLANVIGGAGLSLLASLMAPKNLIFLQIFCLLGCLVCLWAVGQQTNAGAVKPTPSVTSPLERPKQKSLRQDMRALSRSPLLVTISTITVILVVISTLAEYQLDLALKNNFAEDGAKISAYLGSLFFWGGIVACIVQFFITGRVLARFGLSGALLFSPFGYGLGAISILMTGGVLWAAALPRISDVAFRTTINSVATNMLYIPTSSALRKQAKTLVQGVITPPVVIIVGLIFLFLRRIEGISLWHWSIPMLGLVGVWVLLTFRARRQYTHSLAQNLQRSRLSLADLPLNLEDDTTVQVLLDTLQHPDELRVIGALQLLAEAPQSDWLPRIKPLLNHPSATVKITAAKLLAQIGSRAEAEALLALCYAPEETVRAEAIAAYCTLEKEAALGQIMPFLNEADPRIKRAAVVSLIRYGGLDGILPAVEQLKTMLAAEPPRIRLEAARALGELQIHTFYQPLIPLLADPQPAIQLEAIRAAGAVRAEAPAPLLIPKLGQPATRQVTVEALAQFGSSIEPLLAQCLADSTLDQAIRLQLPLVLQRLASPSAATILLNHFEEADRLVRGAVFVALTRLRDAGIQFEIERGRIYEALLLEFNYYYQVYVWHTDLNGSDRPPESLLDEALTVRLDERLDRIFFLLELLYSIETIDTIRAVLQARDSSQRANAIELLDNIIDHEIKSLLLPLIESPAAQVCHLAHQRFGVACLPRVERLGYLAGYPDSWLRSCAIFEIGQLGLTELTGSILTALIADEELVRETAQVANQQLGPMRAV